jgi:uncharacterized membrane protein YuzA (DUF378 family)
MFSQYVVHMILVALVLVGALNWGFHAFGYNLVEMLNRFLSGVFKRRLSLNTIIYVVVALSALYLAFQRETWLPFLGDSVLPGAVVPEKKNSGDTTVDVHVKPGAKVAYWAAKAQESSVGVESSVNGTDKSVNGAESSVPKVRDAYAHFENSGVVIANDAGVATLVFNKGTSYIVPSGREIKSHVHYREFGEDGMMGPVQSVFV